eukprot:ANDGO_05101.mRNA.1 putative protein phosphatase 2C 47
MNGYGSMANHINGSYSNVCNNNNIHNNNNNIGGGGYSNLQGSNNNNQYSSSYASSSNSVGPYNPSATPLMHMPPFNGNCCSSNSFETPNKSWHRTFQRFFCFGTNQNQGPRGKQEDVFCWNHEVSKSVAYFGVFDGHCGAFAANEASSMLCDAVLQQESFRRGLRRLKNMPAQGAYRLDFTADEDDDDCFSHNGDENDNFYHDPNLCGNSSVEFDCDDNPSSELIVDDVDDCFSIPAREDDHSVLMDDCDSSIMMDDLDVEDLQGMFREPIEDAFKSLNQHLGMVDVTKSGTTASIAFFLDGNYIVTANVGDSSIVMFPRSPLTNEKQAKRLSEDHRNKNDGDLEIEVSRSLGDARLNLSCVPDVFLHPVDLLSDGFLVMASDGVWDRVPLVDVDRIVRESLMDGGDPQMAAQKLVEYAVLKKNGQDNATAIVISIQKLSADEGCSGLSMSA